MVMSIMIGKKILWTNSVFQYGLMDGTVNQNL